MIKRRQMAVAYVRSPGYFKAHQRNLNLRLHTCLHTSNHSPAGLIGWRWWLLWVFEMGLQGDMGIFGLGLIIIIVYYLSRARRRSRSVEIGIASERCLSVNFP